MWVSTSVNTQSVAMEKRILDTILLLCLSKLHEFSELGKSSSAHQIKGPTTFTFHPNQLIVSFEPCGRATNLAATVVCADTTTASREGKLRNTGSGENVSVTLNNMKRLLEICTVPGLA